MTEHDRLGWARTLMVAGWCFLSSYIGIIAIELRRAAAISTSSFEDGVWGQRVEIISFVSLPQNISMLAVAALCVAIARIVMAPVHPDDRPGDRWLVRLGRTVGGVAIIVIGLALLGIGGIPFRYADPLADLGALVGRASGIAVAAAALRLVRPNQIEG